MGDFKNEYLGPLEAEIHYITSQPRPLGVPFSFKNRKKKQNQQEPTSGLHSEASGKRVHVKKCNLYPAHELFHEASIFFKYHETRFR